MIHLYFVDVLKIADFGLATLFRLQNGSVRLLDRCCGTLPYAAPVRLQFEDVHFTF